MRFELKRHAASSSIGRRHARDEASQKITTEYIEETKFSAASFSICAANAKLYTVLCREIRQRAHDSSAHRSLKSPSFDKRPKKLQAVTIRYVDCSNPGSPRDAFSLGS